MVPTSMAGMVTDTCRSPLLSFSKRSRHMEDSTFCAGSWPVAMKMAVTMLEAWALKPPTEAAMAEPTRFLAMLSSTSSSTLVLSVLRTTALGMVASATTVLQRSDQSGNSTLHAAPFTLPRPSIQLSAVAFLSVQKLPETAMIWRRHVRQTRHKRGARHAPSCR